MLETNLMFKDTSMVEYGDSDPRDLVLKKMPSEKTFQAEHVTSLTPKNIEGLWKIREKLMKTQLQTEASCQVLYVHLPSFEPSSFEHIQTSWNFVNFPQHVFFFYVIMLGRSLWQLFIF